MSFDWWGVKILSKEIYNRDKMKVVKYWKILPILSFNTVEIMETFFKKMNKNGC